MHEWLKQGPPLFLRGYSHGPESSTAADLVPHHPASLKAPATLYKQETRCLQHPSKLALRLSTALPTSGTCMLEQQMKAEQMKQIRLKSSGFHTSFMPKFSFIAHKGWSCQCVQEILPVEQISDTLMFSGAFQQKMHFTNPAHRLPGKAAGPSLQILSKDKERKNWSHLHQEQVSNETKGEPPKIPFWKCQWLTITAMQMNTQLDPGSSDQPSTMSQNCSDLKREQTVDNLLVAMIWLKNPVWLPRKESWIKKVLLSPGKNYLLMDSIHLLYHKTFKWLEFNKSLTLKCAENKNATLFYTLHGTSQHWSPAVFRHYINHY